MTTTRKTHADELFEMLENHSGDGCLLWPHSLDYKGYGRVWLDGKQQKVHRVVCEWAYGPAPAGKPHVLHAAHEICGNRHCCAPAHLRWGSPAENNADKAADGELAERAKMVRMLVKAERRARMAAKKSNSEQLFEMLENHSGDGCLLWPHAQDRDGYGMVSLDGKMQKVHRVACEWAHGPAPEGKPHALHVAHEICGNKHCCAPAHLRWGNDAENRADMIADGTSGKGERHGQARLAEAQVVEIRERCAAGGVTQKALAVEYGVTLSTIHLIVQGKRWTHVGGPIKGRDY